MEKLTILFHNTFWFQGTPFREANPPAPDENIMDSLLALYRSINPDLVCLQELQSPAAFTLVGKKLKMSGHYCPGREWPQYGNGVFWKKGAPFHCAATSRSHSKLAQRSWQVGEVRLGTSRLRIVNLHLPSGRQLGVEESANQRIAELGEMIATDAGKPDILLGDFNEFPGGSVGDYLTEQGYEDAALLMSAAPMPTNIRGRRVDQAWIRSALRGSLKEFQVLSKEDCVDSTKRKAFLSDHLPIWMTLEIENNA